MKPIFALFFILFLLLQVSNVSYARKDLEGYWKNHMKDQPMPEVIKDLVVQNLQPSVSVAEKDRFVRDFDIRPNVILYHSHSHVASKEKEEKKKPCAKKLEAQKKLNFKEEAGFVEQSIKKG